MAADNAQGRARRQAASPIALSKSLARRHSLKGDRCTSATPLAKFCTGRDRAFPGPHLMWNAIRAADSFFPVTQLTPPQRIHV